MYFYLATFIIYFACMNFILHPALTFVSIYVAYLEQLVACYGRKSWKQVRWAVNDFMIKEGKNMNMMSYAVHLGVK